jgi:DNA-directed RNA polymerase specialized sigma24 family protein
VVHLDQFEGGGSRTLMGWLAAIARNEIRDRAQYLGRQRRDAGARVSWHSSMPLAAETLASEVSRVQLEADLRRLEKGLAGLSEDHREVIVLRRLEELSAILLARTRARLP